MNTSNVLRMYTGRCERELIKRLYKYMWVML